MTAAQPYLIMWLDPGLSTGWAVWYPITMKFLSGVADGLISAITYVTTVLSRPLASHAAIGWEAFTIRPGSSRLRLDTTALEVIGAVKWVAHELGATVLAPAQPADRSLGQKHLKALGWHRPGPDHADSAASHLASYLLRERLMPAGLLAKITSEE
jgi:hypothetical protein